LGHGAVSKYELPIKFPAESNNNEEIL